MNVGLVMDTAEALRQASDRVLLEVGAIAVEHALRYRGTDGMYLVFDGSKAGAVTRDHARDLAAAVFRDLCRQQNVAVSALINLADGIRIA